ncbi:MAG: amino acid permease [Actinobacteria bacterium]|nr:amino acid permease [Actinomycetota bacterium]
MTGSWIDDSPRPTVRQEHAHLKDPLIYRAKKVFLGRPLNRHSISHQRLSKMYALGILSSDGISSSAYGTEQMMIVLLPAFGLAGFTILMPLTFVIISILALVTTSYRQVVMAYTKTGGSYIVARDNFGPKVAQIAAVALMIDYIVTVAIQTAAGTAALISAFQSLAPYSLVITLGVIGILFYGNLRGVKEAGRVFAAPTYFFVTSVGMVILVGVIKEFQGKLNHVVPSAGTFPLGHSQGLITAASALILLRAFANGGSSLTGLEAISNGVSIFKAPEGNNARRTTVIMSMILGTLVLGVSWLATKTHAIPYVSGAPTVISQIADTILGRGTFGHILYLCVQFSTMLILYTGANTPFSGFPFLVNFIAEDGYLPRQLSKRGHRLVFSNGIFFLAGSASLLLVVVGPRVDKLVAFYAIGVFTGFALAGFGMAKRALKLKMRNWRVNFTVNALSGGISLSVVIIFAIVKFTEGAWLIVLIFPIAVGILLKLHHQYVAEQEVLEVDQGSLHPTSIERHDVVVLVDSVDIATVGTVRYARSLQPRNLSAVHFVIDDRRAEIIKRKWDANRALDDIALELVDCPDRRIPNAAVEYAIRATASSHVELTLLFPRRSYSFLLGRLLHDRTAEEIASPISQIPRVVATIVPFDVNRMLTKRSVIVHPIGKGIESRKETERPSTHSVASFPVKTPGVDSSMPVSHFESKMKPINSIQWRERAHIEGRVTSITSSSSNSAPFLTVEVWDETAGVALQFFGRREISGLTVGSPIRAEGMVGEINGELTILNPFYELFIP